MTCLLEYIFIGALCKISITSGQQLIHQHCNAGVSVVKCMKSNDKSIILAAKDDGNIGIYDNELTETGIIDAHNDIVTSLAVLHRTNGNFVSSSWDGCIAYWDLNNFTRPLVMNHKSHSWTINNLAVSSCNEIFASVGNDGFLRLWDPRIDFSSIGCQQIFNIEDVGSAVEFLEPDNNICAVGTDSGGLVFFDIRKSSNKSPFIARLSNLHKLRIRSLISPHRRSTVLLACSDDTSITALNIDKVCNDSSENLSLNDVIHRYLIFITFSTI